MTDYFNNLDESLKKFCEDKNFYPTNDKEFNDFVRTYCELDNLKDFFVELKEPVEIENEPTTLVPILCNQPFYAFIPNVLNAMTDVQKVQAIAMTYNYICNEMSPRLKKKPQLIFVESSKSQATVGYCTIDSSKICVSLSNILSYEDSVFSEFLGAIAHELTHAEQTWECENNWKYVKSQNYDFSKLSSYQKKLLLFQYSRTFGDYVDSLYKKVSQGMETTKYLSDEDITLWLKLETEDNDEWYLLKRLLYVCKPIELAAENNAQKLVKKISKMCPVIFKRESHIDECLSVLKEYGYEISDSDIENFTQMSCITEIASQLSNCTEIIITEIKYLLNIYRTKKVEYTFAKNYEDFENKYFKCLQEKYQEENAQANQQKE